MHEQNIWPRIGAVAVAWFQDIRNRIRIVVWALGAVLLGLGAYLAYLHLYDHSKMTSRDYQHTLLGMRGNIYDCNGMLYPLVMSLPAYAFFLDPLSVNSKKGHTPQHISKCIVENLSLDEDEVLLKFGATLDNGRTNRYNKLGISLDEDVFKALTANTLSGIRYDVIAVRNYPQERRMSHVLGFINKKGIASAGIEQQYDEYLKGKNGVIKGVEDATRREIYEKRKLLDPSIAGNNIFLTLDHNIQHKVEHVLRSAVETNNAVAGWVIVQKIDTGAILAMASYPDFAPDKYTDVTKEQWRNKAISITYEPGSIMKAVTVAAALNERIVTSATKFDVGDGVWYYRGKPLRDHVTGIISLDTVIKKSSNIACAQMGVSLGEDRLVRYLQAFNFGATLDIDLPGEEKGILPRPSKKKTWDPLKVTRMPIGQGIAVTGLQMVNAYSALANGGVMMRPYVVDRIVSAEGEVIKKVTPQVLGRPVRPEVARLVCEMLQGVTEREGTGWRAAVAGYSVGGKTGTAQKSGVGGYSSTDYYASFIGVVPAKKPVFTVLVSIECPKPQHSGGYVAAPAFSKIAAATARYLEIEPDMIPEDMDWSGRKRMAWMTED